MSDNRKETKVVIGGVEHTLLLDEDDAKRYEKAAPEPANKAAKAPANK